MKTNTPNAPENTLPPEPGVPASAPELDNLLAAMPAAYRAWEGVEKQPGYKRVEKRVAELLSGDTSRIPR
jgi:hypothetical protein